MLHKALPHTRGLSTLETSFNEPGRESQIDIETRFESREGEHHEAGKAPRQDNQTWNKSLVYKGYIK